MSNKLTIQKLRRILRGKSLTNKERRFFNNTLSKYLRAENGAEATMGGLTDQGFNYNGAWGGPSMQMGGELLKSMNPKLAKQDKDFIKWYKNNTLEGKAGIPYDSPNSVYDFYSYFKNTPKKELSNPEQHFPDTYKLPNHPTFSNESIYSTPENPGGYWVGEKYFSKGKFNKFEMGGGIPGTVGFTYARTQGAAPSNGPYAKKTKPSAQNGQEMKYYQEGLDFKPKTISQDGSKTKKERQPKKVVVFVERPEDQYVFETSESKQPVLKKKDEFVREAENLKKFYQKTSPKTQVEILPVYNNELDEFGFPTNKTKLGIYKKLSELTPDDDVFVFGHHGSKYGGIPTEQWATMLEQSNYGNCYLGSCGSEDVALGDWKNVRNLKYRPYEPWLGVNPSADNIIDAMFSRRTKGVPISDSVTGEVTSFPSQVVKPVKGQDYSERKGPVTPALAKYSTYASKLLEPSVSKDLGLPYPLLTPSKKKKDGGWLSKYDDGGIIEDPMGQWAYPGEITRIPSNEITMQGVDYPVLGISDTGDTQMMQPGQDYTFDGISVTEIPMMQKGGVAKDPGYSEPDYVTGTSRRALNKMIGMGNYLIPGNVLNQAADLAELKGYGYGEDSSGPLDAVRHASAAASTAAKLPIPKIISDYSPALDRAMRIAAANALGFGYELRNFNREGFLMDIKNNYRGSLVGSIPGLTDKERNKMIVNQLTTKQLTVDNPKKKKENGGWLNKYE